MPAFWQAKNGNEQSSSQQKMLKSWKATNPPRTAMQQAPPLQSLLPLAGCLKRRRYDLAIRLY
jgi:hypothetical protein